MEFLKNRTIGFWIGFAASCLMLIADIIFYITDSADRTFSFVTFMFIMAGVACELLVIVKDFRFAPVLPPVCFGVALSMHLYLGLPTLSDVANGVNFVGGNPTAVVVFGACFFVGTIAAIVSSFMEQSKVAVSDFGQ
ncbi:hypothetical protein [Anaerobium acetethylicum]|uniref:Uncharacterized protein n=1 Tax=Anaerobium acetethylicum TaxID=1619234 RepID=A0A1D3TW55_9FIRM|nr:hypothetical protein [Anaerobium acetethylicum]SCP98435.1 hypothetical protein SAMN05421730_102045 [Anaerobium acetethylicum]